MMQVKNICLRIRYFPTVSQPRRQVEVVIPTDQRIEEKRVASLRLRINPYTGVEVRRTKLDDHDQRVGIGLTRATGKKQERQENKCCHPERASRSGEASRRTPIPVRLAAKTTHSLLCPGSPDAGRRSRMGCLTAGAAMSGRPAGRMRQLPSPVREVQNRRWRALDRKSKR